MWVRVTPKSGNGQTMANRGVNSSFPHKPSELRTTPRRFLGIVFFALHDWRRVSGFFRSPGHSAFNFRVTVAFTGAQDTSCPRRVRSFFRGSIKPLTTSWRLSHQAPEAIRRDVQPTMCRSISRRTIAAKRNSSFFPKSSSWPLVMFGHGGRAGRGFAASPTSGMIGRKTSTSSPVFGVSKLPFLRSIR